MSYKATKPVPIYQRIIMIALLIPGIVILIMGLFNTKHIENYFFIWAGLLILFMLFFEIFSVLVRFIKRPEYLKSPAKFFKREWLKMVIRRKREKLHKYQLQQDREYQQQLHGQSALTAEKGYNRVYHQFMGLSDKSKGELIASVMLIAAIVIANGIIIYAGITTFNETGMDFGTSQSEPVNPEGIVINLQDVVNWAVIIGLVLGLVIANLIFLWKPYKTIKRLFPKITKKKNK